MSQFLYSEHDYAFGQEMLTLRMRIGLTQSGLAELLRVSRKTVSRWEAGSSYPNAEHLQTVLALALSHQVFPVGREKEEIRALWHAAHQKVLLNEQWLHDLLHQQAPEEMPVLVHQTHPLEEISSPPALRGPRVDWGNALDVPAFYGRQEELALLTEWIVQEQCRVVSVLGMGGIGKSALATTVMHQVVEQFEVVIWRSLRDSPACEMLVDDYLQVLAPQILPNLDTSFEERLHLLMQQLRLQRVLLVLDNLETLLKEGTGTGRMRAGFEAYARLLRQVGETAHQSCLLLTSREKPAELIPLEGRHSLVRSIRLLGLDAEAGAELLEEKNVASSTHERTQLVEVYQGNPLALQIVAHTIVELFGGEIAAFLQQGEIVFGGVRDLLEEQFTRLSPLEQMVLLWLAILREPVSLHDLLAVFSTPRTAVQVLEALEGLRRLSLIEQGQRAGSFTLQSVVLEYATARLIDEASREIEQGQLVRLLEYGLCLAHAKEYVRQTQEQLLVVPLLTLMQNTYHEHARMEARLFELLDDLRRRNQETQGYGPANLVLLLRMLRGHLRSLNLSHLALRDVFLQEIDMQDSSLSHAAMQDNVFTEPLDTILAVSMSRTGAYWAAATIRGEIRVWEESGLRLRHSWRAHTEMMVWNLAFSSDERMLASASVYGSIKLWDVGSGTLLWEGWPAEGVGRLAFSPDGGVLASGGLDALIRLWDAQRSIPFRTLPHTSAVFSLRWSPDGRFLASGCADGSIWLWQPEVPEPETRVQVFVAHTDRVMELAFSPDGAQLASASYDGTVKLWNMTTGACLQTFSEHTGPVQNMVWSPDGRILASSSVDSTIRFWDPLQGRASKVLQGHTSLVTSLAFTPDSRTLLSSSFDDTLRVWDVESGQSLRIMEGYTASLLDIDWSPDGTQLASGGADGQVTLWNAVSTTRASMLQEYRGMVQGQGVAWSRDGRLLATGEQDGIGLWDPATGVRLHELHDPDAAGALFQGGAWSPDGSLLAAGSYLRGVQVWETTTRIRRWVEQGQATRIYSVAWSSDGRLLAGGGYDGAVYVWIASNGRQQKRLIGHSGAVTSVAWSPDGKFLASSGGGGREGGQLFVWELRSNQRVHALAGHSQVVSAVVWTPSGKVLISGDSDGELRWWEVESGQCLRVQRGHQGRVQAMKISPDESRLASCGDDGAIRLWNIDSGELLQTLRRDRPYERLNITGIRGLSEAQKASLHALGAFEETSILG
jgi:WD40 repeat protein/transcriptional regulator with XRE-family HTH domain